MDNPKAVDQVTQTPIATTNFAGNTTVNVDVSNSTIIWRIDIGASDHLRHDRHSFLDLVEVQMPYSASLSNGERVTIVCWFSYSLSIIVMSNVLYVPSKSTYYLSVNLILNSTALVCKIITTEITLQTYIVNVNDKVFRVIIFK